MKRLEELEEEEYEVIVDGITVATAEGFHGAFANYLSSFYCLNLQYTTTLAKTLQFFQTVILGIKDTSPKGKQVMRLQAQISKYLPAQEWLNLSKSESWVLIKNCFDHNQAQAVLSAIRNSNSVTLLMHLMSLWLLFWTRALAKQPPDAVHVQGVMLKG